MSEQAISETTLRDPPANDKLTSAASLPLCEDHVAMDWLYRRQTPP